MNIPEFNAELSLFQNGKYRTPATVFSTNPALSIVPSMRPADWACAKECLKSGQDIEFCWWACRIS